MFVLFVLKTTYKYFRQYTDFETQNFVFNIIVIATKSQSFHMSTLHRVHTILLVSLEDKIFIEK